MTLSGMPAFTILTMSAFVNGASLVNCAKDAAAVTTKTARTIATCRVLRKGKACNRTRKIAISLERGSRRDLHRLFWAERSYLLAVPNRAAVSRVTARAGVRCNRSALRIVELDRHDGGSFAAVRRGKRNLVPVLTVIARVEQSSAAPSSPHVIADERYHTESGGSVGENS